MYAKCYYTKINNFLSQISKKDTTLFETPGKIFLEGVDLYDIWNSSSATDINRTAIWKYLQILMILGRRIMPNHKEIVDILNKVSNGDINVPAKVEKTLNSDSKDETEETPSVFGLGDIASSLGGLSSLMNGLNKGGSSGEGGGLGGLMSGLSGLMGGLGGGGGASGGSDSGLGALGGLGSLMGGITDMFSNPDFTNAMSQLSQQFVPPTNSEASGNESVQGSQGSQGSQGGGDESTEDGEAGEAGSHSHSHSSECGTNCSHSSKASETSSGAPPMPPIFNNSLFGDLADEIGKTFNFDEMEKEGKPQNIGEALSRFMSGNNPAKLMELVGKFGGKLQDEVKKGNINPAELLKQTMSAAGGGQNLQNMMKNQTPQQQNKMKQAQQNNATRDRLRAKLEKKNSEKKDN